ncbi:MAG: metallophosphoesterase [Burkholderiaceae bacterium]
MGTYIWYQPQMIQKIIMKLRKYFSSHKTFSLNCLVLLLLVSNFVNAKGKDSIINFIFTSDVHFGLTKDYFRGKENVSARDVDMAMMQVMNNLYTSKLPADKGVLENKIIGGIDALVITGDIANRMEKGVQSATASWKQFEEVFIGSNHLQKANGTKAELLVVPGNHDMSNAIGFHRPMEPKKDAASMIGIYNLMFPNNKVSSFDSSLHRIHYSRDINGVHFIFLSLYPDSAERVWMEKDLKNIAITTPVFLFAHSIPDVEPRFFENPNGIHDINEEDKFENLVPERYKDGRKVKGETTIEQNEFVDFIIKHPNIKAYFHGHENWTEYYKYTGPLKNINLICIRTDSPMKGRISLKDEKKLAFELISVNIHSGLFTIREVLWNEGATSFNWGMTANYQLK